MDLFVVYNKQEGRTSYSVVNDGTYKVQGTRSVEREKAVPSPHVDVQEDVDGAESDATHICDKESAAGAGATALAVTPVMSGTCVTQSGRDQRRRRKWKIRPLGLFAIPYIDDDSDGQEDVDDADSDATHVSGPESSPEEEGSVEHEKAVSGGGKQRRRTTPTTTRRQGRGVVFINSDDSDY